MKLKDYMSKGGGEKPSLEEAGEDPNEAESEGTDEGSALAEEMGVSPEVLAKLCKYISDHME